MAEEQCEHMNADGTFKGGFDGCVAHMQARCGGKHSKESATLICAAIAREKAGGGGRGDGRSEPYRGRSS